MLIVQTLESVQVRQHLDAHEIRGSAPFGGWISLNRSVFIDFKSAKIIRCEKRQHLKCIQTIESVLVLAIY